jgi:WD40 repeat protein
MRRPAVLSTAALLILTACQGGGTSSGTTEGTAAGAASTQPAPGETALPGSPGSSGPLPAPDRVVEEADGVRRFGEGRALLAAHDPVADRTVVATTIGLVVQAGEDEPQALTDELATMLATSPDGGLAAVMAASGRLEVWDVSAPSTEPVAAVDTDPGRFSSLTFSGDHAVVAAGEAEVARLGVDGTFEALRTAPEGTTFGPVAVDGAGAVAVPVQSPTPTVATWAADGTAGEIDLGMEEGTRLTGVVWSADGGHLAVLYAEPTGSDTVGIWDVPAERFTAQTPVPNLVLPHQLTFPTPDRVVLPNFDRVVAYDLTGTEVGSFPIGESAVSEIDAAGGAAIVSRLDGTLTRWTVEDDPAELTDRTVTLVDQRGGTSVTVVDQVGLVRAFDSDGNERHRFDRWAVGEATAVDVGADGALVLATSRGAVRVIDGPDVTAVLDRAQGDVSDVSIAPDDRRIATGVSVQKRAEAWDDTIEVTDVATATSAFTLGGEAEDVSGCAFYEANVVFSPDGAVLASSSHDFTVQVSPVDDAGETVVLEPHLGSVLDIDFSPDGTTLLTSADDGTLRMWDVDGWRLRAEVPAAPGGWFAIAYSPDGSLLAASDVSGAISLLDPETGAVVRTFGGTRAVLGDMVFTPDGASLVAPLPDGAVGIWSAASGTIEHELRGHTLPVNSLAVSADGTTVVTASQDGTVRTWPLPSA